MSRFTDTRYLRDEQYRDDSNLRARIDLHARFSTNPEPWHRWVFDRFEFGAEDRILELGCGPGELWAQNLDRIPSGWRLTLADLSAGMLNKARAVLGDRAELVLADAQELPFEDASFDGAIANHMLYHVPDRRQALAELARVLRPGGLFYASANGVEHLKELRPLRTTPWEVDFVLDSGRGELEEQFVDVRLELYPCDLEVTEVEPVLAFVRSSSETVPDAERIIREQIERRGAFHVTKSSGMFCCRKP